MLTRVKTFVENRWYKRITATHYVADETTPTVPLDQQINEWVEREQVVVVHPGQLGMHTAWHGTPEDPYQLKCVTLGLSVLYQERSDERAATNTSDHAS